MPNLKEGEQMHLCESPICYKTTAGARAGKPRYYIVRTYFEQIERHWCSTCLGICATYMTHGIHVRYTKGVWDGYEQREV
jgi:hypothetical protein